MAGASGIFRKVLGLASSTMLSRILGFFREIFCAYYIGGGLVMSAWSYAIMVPNLFRRILGEGAMGTALIPVISYTLTNGGHAEAKKKFSTVFLWITLALAVISVIVTAAALIFSPFVVKPLWKLALHTIPLVMPYCILICLVGIATSLLNSLRIFFWPGMASLSLNIVMIAAIVLFCPGLRSQPQEMLKVLSYAVLVSGVIEIVILGFLLKKQGMFPAFSKEIFFNYPALGEVLKLALPGIIGMSALQVSLLADKTISMFIGNYANAALYYSDRLVYLPVGIFAVAFGTVSVAEMSKLAAEGKIKTVLLMQFTAIRQLLYITIPIAIFMALFGKEIASILFQRGAFTRKALNEMYLAMFYYSLGIPFFAMLKVTLAGFYCRKQMITPVKVSIICIAVNIIMNLILMVPMKQGGIALATVISSVLNNAVLFFILRRDLGRMPLCSTVKYAFIILGISLFSIFPGYLLFRKLVTFPELLVLPKYILPFLIASVLCGFLYFSFSMLLRIREMRFVTDKIFSKFKRFKTGRN